MLAAELKKPYVPELDDERLIPNIDRVRDLMLDGKWRTYAEIADETGLVVEYVQSPLRDLRKEKNGSYVVCRRPRGSRLDGLFEYQVLPPGSDSEWDGAGEPKKLGRGFEAGVMFALKTILAADPEFKTSLGARALKAKLYKAKEPA